MFRSLRIFPIAILAACAGAKTHGTPADAGPGDAGSICTESALPACAAAMVTGQTFAIDPSGQYEIERATAYDGTIWIAYNRGASDSANFDVWLTRLGCDGTVLLPPVKANTTGTNNVGPTIAVSSSAVLVAWTADSGMFPNNLTIRYRLFTTHGEAISAAEQTLQTTQNGAPATLNAWEQSEAALPDGDFAIAGVRAQVDTGSWQAFVQFLDTSGSPSGATIDSHPESGVAHQDTAISAGPDGSIFLAWARETASDMTLLPLVHTELEAGAQATMPSPPATAFQMSTGDYPSLSTGPSSCPTTYLAFESPLNELAQIIVVDAAKFDPDAPGLQVSTTGDLALAPAIAAARNGGALAWVTETASARQLLFATFSYDGKSWALGPVTQIMTASEVTTETPSIVNLGPHGDQDAFLVTWSEGSGAATAGKAMIVP